MTLIPLTIFSQAVQQLPLAHDQDHEAALAAAEAGVDDYLNHLAQNGNYWTYNPGNPPPDGNQAFNAWVAVPGPRTTANASATTSTRTNTASTGIVYLTSSGKRLTNPNLVRVRRRHLRTVTLGLRRQGFLDYLWLTDYEITDPVLTGASTATCKFRAWEYNSVTRNNSTVPIQTTNCASCTGRRRRFRLNGPVHSNDGLYVCGNPTFMGSTDTYYNSATAQQPAEHVSSGGGACLNPLNCTNAPVLPTVPAPR